MGYEEFKGKLLEALQDFYGKKFRVEIIRIQRTNGLSYDGIQIALTGAGQRITPVIRLEEFYEAYCLGKLDIEDCARGIYKEMSRNALPEGVEEFVDKLSDWDSVKNHIYPVLISTEMNRELLKTLVSIPLLDLSVVYIIRKEMPDGSCSSVKISKLLLEEYGISSRELHIQAMKNLEKDGYKFLAMKLFLQEMMQTEGIMKVDKDAEEPEMYILTNSKSYGAAGILNRKMVKAFAKGRDYFILPSSLHETIFVPASDRVGKEFFDAMVKSVNEEQVSVEERLSDHCYYYDARKDEIRMCA